MIHHDNETSLLRILGVRAIPADVRDEVELRTRMYHSDGNSGPLPTIALIDAVRFCGKTRPVDSAEKAKVQWRDMPQDGTTRVEAFVANNWLPGVFLGFVSAGTLMVRLDGIAFVQECQPGNVRLATAPVEPVSDPINEVPPTTTDEEDEKIDFAGRDADDVPFDTNGGTAVAVATRPARASTGAVNRGGHDMHDDVVTGNENWPAVQAGAAVWVEVDNDILDGTFVGLNENGKVKVNVNGSVREIDPDEARLAS